MSVLGIISEYNPYHKGHAYLLENAKEMTGAEFAVSVMSGCFSQQGLPMVQDKYLRASAATASGIDLIFELPVLFATGSARDFAEGAVFLTDRLGIVDFLCFGVETPDEHAFNEAAQCILEEPDRYRDVLLSGLKNGKSYPAAREDALTAVLGESVRSLVQSPNNILALEYLIALKRFGSRIRPCLIKRNTDYHAGQSASATTIRNHLSSLYEATDPVRENDAESYLKEQLPGGAFSAYCPVASRMILSPSDLMPYLAARILALPEDSPQEELPMGMTPEMYHRLKKLPLPSTYEELVDGMKRKNETRGRITRSLLHLLLGLKEKDRITFSNEGFYLNLLSARKESTHLLRSVETLSVITRKAAYAPEGERGKRMWDLDLTASRLYSQLLFSAHGIRLPDEMQRTPVIL